MVWLIEVREWRRGIFWKVVENELLLSVSGSPDRFAYPPIRPITNAGAPSKSGCDPYSQVLSHRIGQHDSR
jgi:hypothetical protein